MTDMDTDNRGPVRAPVSLVLLVLTLMGIAVAMEWEAVEAVTHSHITPVELRF